MENERICFVYQETHTDNVDWSGLEKNLGDINTLLKVYKIDIGIPSELGHL